jgi:hypothetical protein
MAKIEDHKYTVEARIVLHSELPARGRHYSMSALIGWR